MTVHASRSTIAIAHVITYAISECDKLIAHRTLDFALYEQFRAWPDGPHWFLRLCHLAYTLTVFFQSDAATAIFLLFVLVGLLFKGGIYFVGKLADNKDDCIRYITCFVDLLPSWCEAT